MRVLITGAAGGIGQTLIEGMKDRHTIRGLDRLPTPNLEDSIVGDTADRETVQGAMEGMEAAIHLATEGPDWNATLRSVQAIYNVLEAALETGTRRIVLTSRAGFLDDYPHDEMRRVDMVPCPRSHHDVGKIAGENLGYMYACEYDLEVVVVRIGNFKAGRTRSEHPRILSTGDAVRVYEQAIIHPGVKYEIVFGVSDSDWRLYDTEHGRQAIGYEPGDMSKVPLKNRTYTSRKELG